MSPNLRPWDDQQHRCIIRRVRRLVCYLGCRQALSRKGRIRGYKSGHYVSVKKCAVDLDLNWIHAQCREA